MPRRSGARPAAAAAAGLALLALLAPLALLAGPARGCEDPEYRPGNLTLLAPVLLTPPAIFSPFFVQLFADVRATLEDRVAQLANDTLAAERGEPVGGRPALGGGARLALRQGDSGVDAVVTGATLLGSVNEAAAAGETVVGITASISSVSDAAAFVAASLGLPLVTYGSTSPRVIDDGAPYTLRSRSAHVSNEMPLVLEAMRLAGWTKAALFIADDALGLAVAFQLQKFLREERARAGDGADQLRLAQHLYSGAVEGADELSLDEAFSAIYRDRRRVVIMYPTVPLHMAAILRAARRNRVTAAEGFVFVISSVAYRAVRAPPEATREQFIDDAGAVLGHALWVDSWSPTGQGYEPYEAYAREVARVPDALELWARDAVEMYARALANLTQACEDVTPAAVHARLAASSFDGVSGPVRFNDAGERSIDEFLYAIDARALADGTGAVTQALATAVAVRRAGTGASELVDGVTVAWPPAAAGSPSGAPEGAPPQLLPLADAPGDELPALPAGSGSSALSDEAVAAICASAVVVAMIALMTVYVRRARIEVAVTKRRAAEEGAFHAFILHELRNPLNAVNSFVRFSYSDLREFRGLRTPGGGGDGKDAGAGAGADNGEELLDSAVADLSSALVSCDRVVEVLDNVMDLSKLATGSATFVERPFSPAQLAAQLGDMMRGVRKTVELRIEPGEDLPPCVLGDENKLKHVLLNMLSNAMAATTEGYVALRITRAADAAAGGAGGEAGEAGAAAAVLFEVRDTGKGIDEDSKRRLFEKYYSSGKRNGTGLGLYLCDQFVRLMGSRVEVESPWASDGSTGSRFSFVLPMKLAPASELRDDCAASENGSASGREEAPRDAADDRAGLGLAAAAASSTVLPSGNSRDGGGEEAAGDGGGDAARGGARTPLLEEPEVDTPRGAARRRAPSPAAEVAEGMRDWRVLVADDLVMNRRILQRLLTRTGPFAGRGWSVTHASTGEEALEAVARAKQPFDLLVCDQNMSSAGGEMLGSEVVARLSARSTAEAPGPLLVVSSGNCSEEDFEQYARAGAHLVWAKPLPKPKDMWHQLVEAQLAAARARRRRERRQRASSAAADDAAATAAAEPQVVELVITE